MESENNKNVTSNVFAQLEMAAALDDRTNQQQHTPILKGTRGAGKKKVSFGRRLTHTYTRTTETIVASSSSATRESASYVRVPSPSPTPSPLPPECYNETYTVFEKLEKMGQQKPRGEHEEKEEDLVEDSTSNADEEEEDMTNTTIEKMTKMDLLEEEGSGIGEMESDVSNLLLGSPTLNLKLDTSSAGSGTAEKTASVSTEKPKGDISITAFLSDVTGSDEEQEPNSPIAAAPVEQPGDRVSETDVVQSTPTHLLRADTAGRQNIDQTHNLPYTPYRPGAGGTFIALNQSTGTQRHMLLDDITLNNIRHGQGGSLLEVSSPADFFASANAATSSRPDRTYTVPGFQGLAPPAAATAVSDSSDTSLHLCSPAAKRANTDQTYCIPAPSTAVVFKSPLPVTPKPVVATVPTPASSDPSSPLLGPPTPMDETSIAPKDPRLLMSEEEFEQYSDSQMEQLEAEYVKSAENFLAKQKRYNELRLARMDFEEKLVNRIANSQQRLRDKKQQIDEQIRKIRLDAAAD